MAKKIREARLQQGDRVLIGANILKVLSPDCVDEDLTVRDEKPLDSLTDPVQSANAKRTAGRMAGRIEEIPLPDLLQLLCTGKKTGVLSVAASRDAFIYLRKGRIVFCEVPGSISTDRIEEDTDNNSSTVLIGGSEARLPAMLKNY